MSSCPGLWVVGLPITVASASNFISADATIIDTAALRAELTAIAVEAQTVGTTRNKLLTAP